MTVPVGFPMDLEDDETVDIRYPVRMHSVVVFVITVTKGGATLERLVLYRHVMAAKVSLQWEIEMALDELREHVQKLGGTTSA